MAIHFIGATDNKKLKVNIVGIKMTINAKVLPNAPIPTVSPPRQPTTNKMMAIHPKRLNSISLTNLSNIFSFSTKFDVVPHSIHEISSRKKLILVNKTNRYEFSWSIT